MTRWQGAWTVVSVAELSWHQQDFVTQGLQCRSLAAGALGLDCQTMAGFDADKLNAEFFPNAKWKVNPSALWALETETSSSRVILSWSLRKPL